MKTGTALESQAVAPCAELRNDEFVPRARAAARQVAGLSVADRIKHLSHLRYAILDRQEFIIDAIQKETRKCRTDALVSEIFSVLDHLHFLEKNAARLLSDRAVPTPLPLFGKKSRIWYEPFGVVLVISPWNYPFFLSMVPITGAFVAGNAVVFKPSEHTPMKGLVEGLLKQAGFSRDWVQVVYGAGDVGSRLINERPDKIFFTGSVATGKKILADAAPHLIPVDLELGGKDPMIVFEDANLERAVAGALWGAFTNTGQACTSVERCYVHESIYERFKKVAAERAAGLTLGVDGDGTADLGFMTAAFQVKKIRDQIEEAKAKGARLLTGAEWNGEGMMPPIVVEGATPGMKLHDEETFGPVLPIIPFRDEAHAVKLANESEYGLSASVWSKDLARAERVARRLRVGNVSINNVMLTEGNAALPFGGVKHSGFGRSKGEAGLYAFCNTKSVLVDKNSKKIETNWYPYTAEKYRLFSDLIQALFRGGLVNLFKFVVTGMKLESLAGRVWRARGKK